jgi:hypothetical protein
MRHRTPLLMLAHTFQALRRLRVQLAFSILRDKPAQLGRHRQRFLQCLEPAAAQRRRLLACCLASWRDCLAGHRDAQTRAQLAGARLRLCLLNRLAQALAALRLHAQQADIGQQVALLAADSDYSRRRLLFAWSRDLDYHVTRWRVSGYLHALHRILARLFTGICAQPFKRIKLTAQPAYSFYQAYEFHLRLKYLFGKKSLSVFYRPFQIIRRVAFIAKKIDRIGKKAVVRIKTLVISRIIGWSIDESVRKTIFL